MKFQFRVHYRRRLASGELGPIEHEDTIAEKQEQAMAVVTRYPDIEVGAVQRGLAVVDWSKPVFDRLEVAEAFNRKHDFVTSQQAAGKFPKSPSGHAVFRPRVFEDFVEKGKAA